MGHLISKSNWTENKRTRPESTLASVTLSGVVVQGLLNFSAKTLIPQKIFPKGPTEAKDNMFQRFVKKGRAVAKKIKSNADLFIFIPAAIVATMI